jgi:hypothetical protein
LSFGQIIIFANCHFGKLSFLQSVIWQYLINANCHFGQLFGLNLINDDDDGHFGKISVAIVIFSNCHFG